MIKLLKESYGDLSDYLERHLDSWYGRLNELGDAIEDLGLDVDEINNEYVIVHAAEPDGEDVYCKIWLGGTPRTISLETFEMLESVRRSRNVLRESDDKITARSFQELISKLEDHGYSCEHYYDMKYPESNWLYITKNGDPYEAEFYRYSDGEYELYLHNIHPTRRRNESVKRRKIKENTNTENKMIITVGSSLNADGFDILIIDENQKKLFQNSYHYGYNASWKQSWANNDKPYVTDIIKDLCDRYGITRQNIEVTSGKNVFTGSNIDDKAVARFIKDYIDENLKRKNRRPKKAISEFYQYSYDNQRISDILDKIEQTNDQRKIDKAYDFINHACDNIDHCTETGFYDLSNASWAYGTDYIIEELTDILNESIKRGNGNSIKENLYRVWYNPYLLEPEEEDYIEVTAETSDDARQRAISKGYVTSVEEIDNLTDPYDESKTRTKRNKLMEKSNFDDTQKAIDYYYPKWYYDDMSVNDIYDSLEKLGHSQDFIDVVIDGITEKYEDEEDYELDDYDECLDEANVVGMGGGYPNVYLPKAAKEYLKRKGFQEVNTEIGPCFYMRFAGNDVWEIYIDEQYGGIYVVQEGYELRPTDDIATIDDYDYKDDIDAVINLGNCLSNGEDFDSCLNAFFN